MERCDWCGSSMLEPRAFSRCGTRWFCSKKCRYEFSKMEEEKEEKEEKRWKSLSKEEQKYEIRDEVLRDLRARERTRGGNKQKKKIELGWCGGIIVGVVYMLFIVFIAGFFI